MEALVQLLIIAVKELVFIVALLLCVAYTTWLERRTLGFIQLRYGPNRVGPFGLLQPIADGLKLLFKEDIIPSKADIVYLVAPGIGLASTILLLAVIPVGGKVSLFGRTIPLYITDLNVGLLYVLGISTLGSYGVILGGWSPDNKYGLIGALRGSAQMISYEVVMGVSALTVVLLSGSTSLVDIVKSQSELWNIVKNPVTFIIFLICAFAEINRTPFDMPEAESELACGFNIEFSSMKFALFFLAEYAHLWITCAIITTLFLGGWYGPLLPGFFWFFIKTLVLVFICIWVRATLPRFRYDQIMKFGWKVLLPISLANLFVTSVVMVVVH